MLKLQFSPGRDNSKLRKLSDLTGKRVYSFSLLSGHSCPFANKCRSMAVETDNGRRIMDGPNTEFRCFSASQEVLFTGVYNQRKANFDLLRNFKSVDDLTNCIIASFPEKAEIVRIHVAGDFYSPNYFKAWTNVARSIPSVLFYAYTKSLRYWTKYRDKIPSNLMLTASYGGTDDELIAQHGLRYSQVVAYSHVADSLGLVVDNDDSHAALPEHKNTSFALVVHGTQPAGTEYAKAVAAQRKAVNS